MYQLYKKCNHKYAYHPSDSPKYTGSMSLKGTILCTLSFLFSKYIWTTTFDPDAGYHPAAIVIPFLYFMDSLYVDYIFCKYTYFGKYANIDEQARAGDWLSCIYIADSILVLVGSIFAIFLSVSIWPLPAVKASFLILLGVSVFLVLPVFQVTSRKLTLLWCLLRIVLHGTVQRVSYLWIFITEFHKL